MSKQMQYLRVVLLLFFVFIMYGGTSLVQAQDATVEFPGEVVAIDGNIISVGGISVDISNTILPGDGLAVGMTVQVIGIRQDQTILATVIVITDYGTVIIPTNVSDTDTEPPPPVSGTTGSDPIIVIGVSGTTGGVPIIVIEGPVQAINVSSIVIFDIEIEVDSSDPILIQIRIGDTVRVEGESSFEGNTFVIIAINITIVHSTLIVIHSVGPTGVVIYVSLPSSCKRTKKGKVTCKKHSKKNTKKSKKKSNKKSS